MPRTARGLLQYCDRKATCALWSDVGQLLHELYDRASYDLRLDYTGEPESPLLAAEALWADQLLHQQGLR